MKFDYVIGNPPYQEVDGGSGASATPVYNKFIEETKALNPTAMSFIIPAKWYSGGKGLDEFREQMLNDKRMAVLVDYPNRWMFFRMWMLLVVYAILCGLSHMMENATT